MSETSPPERPDVETVLALVAASRDTSYMYGREMATASILGRLGIDHDVSTYRGLDRERHVAAEEAIRAALGQAEEFDKLRDLQRWCRQYIRAPGLDVEITGPDDPPQRYRVTDARLDGDRLVLEASDGCGL